MQDLIEVLGLEESLGKQGFKASGINFEAFYDDLAASGKNEVLRKEIEEKTYQYFSSLNLPNKPTIYDYLILSLRDKDLIASFNWDPFLMKAYLRNEIVTKDRRPRIAFLHGNVMVGVCEKDKVSGVNGRQCSLCNETLRPSKLLFPVKHKDYNSDLFIKGEWDALRSYLNKAYYLTVYGYSAPKTDVEARGLMLEVWKRNKSLKLAEVDVIDTRKSEEIEKSWDEFFYSHHYMITDNIFKSYLFQQPRRSCDAFASATLMVDPWHSNPFPRFETLEQLQEWVKPLIHEEEEYERNKTPFSGKFLPPNKGDF